MALAPSITIVLPNYPFDNLSSTATIATLRALASTTLANGDNMAVDGSATIGDGGGGLYVWDDLSVLDDNGVSIIKPTDVAPLAAGRWVLTGYNAEAIYDALAAALSAGDGITLDKNDTTNIITITGTIGASLVAADLAALKASPLSSKVKLLGDKLYVSATGDYSIAPLGPPDDLNVVAANATASSAGAWVLQTANQQLLVTSESFLGGTSTTTLLTITDATLFGKVRVNDEIYVGGVYKGKVNSFGTGTGGVGTYNVTLSQTYPALTYFTLRHTVSARRTVANKVGETLKSMFDYAGATFQEKLQNAVDMVPLSSDLVIHTQSGNDNFILTGPINITRRLNLRMEGSYIGGNFGANVTDYMFDINVGDVVNLDNRGMKIKGLRAFFNTGGGGVIRLRNRAPNLANNATILENLTITGPTTGANIEGTPGSLHRFAIRLDGFGTHKTIIQDCPAIAGGIGNFAVDGCTVRNNMVTGNSCFYYMAAFEGAFGTIIEGNIGRTRDGFAYIEQGSQISILRNQIEQSGGTNTSAGGAQVRLYGNGVNNVIRNVIIEGNSFGGGDNVQVPLEIHSHARNILIEKNQFYLGDRITHGGRHIRIVDPTVVAVKIAPDNYVRGLQYNHNGVAITPYYDPYNIAVTGAITLGTTLTTSAVATDRIIQVGDIIYQANTSTIYGRVLTPGANPDGGGTIALRTVAVTGTLAGSVFTVTSTPSDITQGTRLTVSGAFVGTVQDLVTDNNTLGLTGAYNVNTTENVASTTLTLTNTHGLAYETNTYDGERMLSVQDGGTATSGVVKTSASFGLVNGWTDPGTVFRFLKTVDGHLEIEGTLSAGTLTAATIIGTFPVGSRPRLDKRIRVFDSVNNVFITLRVATTGVVTLVDAATAGAVLNFENIIQVKGQPSFSGGL